jgi:hypothetical protein
LNTNIWRETETREIHEVGRREEGECARRESGGVASEEEERKGEITGGDH